MAENLSGVPPAVSLSGLDAGDGGFSGASQQGLGGSGAYGATPFGMTGGMDLNSLMQLLGGSAEAGVGTGGDIGQSLSQGSLGQQSGGISAGAFGQTQPQPGYTAGQSATGSPGSMGAGSADPFALIQKTLGLAQKGVGLAGSMANTASPTGGSDLSLNGPLFQPEGVAGQVGTASPTLAQDMQGGLMGTSGLQDPTLNSLFTTGALNGWDGSQASLEAMMASDPSLKSALFGGEVGGSLGETMSAPGGSAGFTLGTGSEGASSPTNWAGAAQGGIGGTMGLLNLIRGIEGGNATQGVGGGLQSIGGLAQLLQQSGLGGSLGAAGSGIGGLSALGSVGAGAGGLGGLLGLAGGAQTLAEGGDAGSAAMQLGSGALGTYGALSTLFPSLFPSISSAIAGLGATGGAAAAGTAGTAGASAATGAAGAGAALPLGMIAGPYVVAKLIQFLKSGTDQEAASRSGEQYKRFMGSLPDTIQRWQDVPGMFDQVNQGGLSSSDAQGLLRTLTNTQQIYRDTGMENFLSAGGTTSMLGGGNADFDPGVNFEQGPAIFKSLQPFRVMQDLSRMRLIDQLGAGGMTPEQIGPDYTSATNFAHGLIPRSKLYGEASETGQLPEGAYQFGNDMAYGPGAEALISGPGSTDASRLPYLYTAGPDGNYMPKAMLDRLNAIKPGSIESELFKMQQEFGDQSGQPGVGGQGWDPLYSALGFGQPYGPQPQGFAPQTQGVDPAIMAQSMSPQASTAMNMPQQQGMMTEETLMDMLRRMQMGGA